MRKPLVTVIMAAYNHQDYVIAAIESVLKQRDVSFEFLIADDGSTDNTPNIISQIKDDRIRFFPKIINSGACNAINELISIARGDYISIINSDDIWDSSDKLKLQAHILDTKPEVGATFSKVKYIDKNGHVISKKTLPFKDVFDQDNKSRAKWLRQFYDCGNCLCHPTVLIRKSLFDTIGHYNNALRQLPDFLMWIQLVKHTGIYIMPDELVKFRINHGTNVSGPERSNLIRDANEHMLVSGQFFDGVPHSLLKSGFEDLMVNKTAVTEAQLEIEKMLLLINCSKMMKKTREIAGLIKLFNMLNNPYLSDILKREYFIDDIWFHQRAGKITALIGDDQPPRKKSYITRLKKKYFKN